MKGYIRLHRKLMEWEWFGDRKVLQLFILILLKANHKNKKWQGVEIARGQFYTSLKTLSDETGMSVQMIRTALSKLQSTGEITNTSTKLGRMITLNNYSEYQTLKDVKQQRRQQTSNKAATTTNNEKNDNKEKEYSDHFMTFWEKYPKKVGKKKAFTAWQKANCENGILSEVMKGVDAYREHCLKEETEQRFIAHPTTWLNNERWTDEYSTDNNEPEYFNPFAGVSQ